MEIVNKTTHNDPVIIVGGGITGCTLALYLAQKGFCVKVFDKRSRVENSQQIRKRTVGMSISERGITTLKDLGIYEKYKATLVPKYGRAVHVKDEGVFYQYYGKNKEAIYTINREKFHAFLMECCLEQGRVEFCFNSRFDGINVSGKKAIFNSGTDKRAIQAYSYLFGCDGTFSAVRALLGKRGLLSSTLNRLDFRFKEIYIPPKNGKYVLDPNFVHIWNISELLFVTLPDGQQGFNGTLFYTGNSEFAQIKEEDALFDYVDKNCHFLDFIDEEQFMKEFKANPESDIYEVECEDWNYKDEIMVLGDAAHAMPPFYAMGMNTCMETVRSFSDLLNKNKADVGKTILEFTAHRKANTEAMKQMARINYDKLKKCHHHDFDKKWNEARAMMQNSKGAYETEYFQVAFTNKPFEEIKANKIQEATDWISNAETPIVAE